MLRCVALCFALLGPVACTSASHSPVRTEQTPSVTSRDPQLKTVPESDPFTASHVLLREEAWYADGPHQSRPPDGVLKVGTRVRLLRNNGSYSVVELSNGRTAYVTTGSLKGLR